MKSKVRTGVRILALATVAYVLMGAAYVGIIITTHW